MRLKTAAEEMLDCAKWINDQQAIVSYQQMMNMHAALLEEQRDWSMLEAAKETLREHMAEIHRLRAAGWQALEALEIAMRTPINEYLPREPLDAIYALRAALEPVTDCHGKEGDKLAPPLDRSADTGKTSDDPETNFGNMAQVFDSAEADHIPDAGKMVASVREDRTVEATSQESRQVEPVAWLQIGVGDHEGTVIATTTKPKTWSPDWWRFEPLYTAPPKREPLTNAQIGAVAADIWGSILIAPQSYQRFARAIERAHGIGGEE